MGSDNTTYVQDAKTKDEVADLFRSTTSKIEQQVNEEQEQQSGSAKNQQSTNDQEHRVRNVFISFHAKDKSAVELLRYQAKRENSSLEFRDYSVTEPVEKWRTHVKEKISATSATIVMIGPDTASRPNVIYEIEQSYAMGKKVIGVRIRADKNHPIPEIMKKNKAPIVNWKLEEIQEELDK